MSCFSSPFYIRDRNQKSETVCADDQFYQSFIFFTPATNIHFYFVSSKKKKKISTLNHNMK